jgi:hypothetical protein
MQMSGKSYHTNSSTNTSGFRIIPNALFFKHLPHGRPFTPIEALLSLDRDLYQRGRLLSERSYARIWKRSRKWVRRRIEEFHADPVYQQRTVEHGVDQTFRQEPRGFASSVDQRVDHPVDQGVDQQGATTLRQRQKQTPRERERESDAAASPLSALSGLLDLVKQERPEWSEVQRPKNPEAAIRDMVRRFARAEREAPAASATAELSNGSGHPKRALVKRRLAFLGHEHPTEGQIRAHWRQFAEELDLGPYVPTPDRQIEGFGIA